jgi:hypothetical protein
MIALARNQPSEERSSVLTFFDLYNHDFVNEFPTKTKVDTVVFSKDGSLVGLVSYWRVYIMRVDSGDTVQEFNFPKHSDNTVSMNYSIVDIAFRDQNTFTAYNKDSVYVCSVETGKKTHTRLRVLCLSQDGTIGVIDDGQGNLVIHDIDSNTLIGDLNRRYESWDWSGFSSDGSTFVTVEYSCRFYSVDGSAKSTFETNGVVTSAFLNETGTQITLVRYLSIETRTANGERLSSTELNFCGTMRTMIYRVDNTNYVMRDNEALVFEDDNDGHFLSPAGVWTVNAMAVFNPGVVLL